MMLISGFNFFILRATARRRVKCPKPTPFVGNIMIDTLVNNREKARSLAISDIVHNNMIGSYQEFSNEIFSKDKVSFK